MEGSATGLASAWEADHDRSAVGVHTLRSFFEPGRATGRMHHRARKPRTAHDTSRSTPSGRFSLGDGRSPGSRVTASQFPFPTETVSGITNWRLTAYSYGGSCGFGPEGPTAFPFHPIPFRRPGTIETDVRHKPPPQQAAAVDSRRVASVPYASTRKSVHGRGWMATVQVTRREQATVGGGGTCRPRPPARSPVARGSDAGVRKICWLHLCTNCWVLHLKVRHLLPGAPQSRRAAASGRTAIPPCSRPEALNQRSGRKALEARPSPCATGTRWPRTTRKWSPQRLGR